MINNTYFPIVMTPSIFRIVTGILITEKMTGKMEGMQSLSTSCLANPFCMARRNDPDSICSKCYAAQALAYRKSQNNAYLKNFEILTSRMLTDAELPIISAYAFRFEAFGDVYNLIQMYNYIAIARHNPNVAFSLWSKNIAIVEKAFTIFGKPANMTFVYSVSKMNASINTLEFKREHPFVDHVFVVVDSTHAIKNNIAINCARKCISCMKCYNKNTDFIIYEILKQEETKYFKKLASA